MSGGLCPAQRAPLGSVRKERVMAQCNPPGLTLRGAVWHIDKDVYGTALRLRSGAFRSGSRANGWCSPGARRISLRSTPPRSRFASSQSARKHEYRLSTAPGTRFRGGMLRGTGFPRKLRCSGRRIGGATRCMYSRNASPAATMRRSLAPQSHRLGRPSNWLAVSL